MANVAPVKPEPSARLYDLSNPEQRARWEQQWLLRRPGIPLDQIPPARLKAVPLYVVPSN